MRWKLALAGVAVAVLLAAGVYAWGAGAFWPCETFGRAIGGRCDRVFAVDGRDLNGLAVLPDGHLVSIIREAGARSPDAVTLAEIDPETGTANETPFSVDGMPAGISVSHIAVDGAGDRLALAVPDLGTIVIARDAQVETVIDRGNPAYLAFDADGHLLIEMGGNTTGIPDVARTEVFDLASPTSPPASLHRPPPPGMFARGVQTALTGDGRLYARGVPSGRSGAAGVQVGPVEDRAAPGLILATQLRPGCTYNLPPLAFSPSGSKLAAILSCSPRWGTVGSALAIWDVTSGEVLVRIPTGYGFGAMAWFDDSRLYVTRYDPEAAMSELFAITVPAH